ncbi:MAG: hypothetical protein JWN86_935 [Planctomycetota bacterium]|nr:hypothetical protein [Planctomycetota bacterium]
MSAEGMNACGDDRGSASAQRISRLAGSLVLIASVLIAPVAVAQDVPAEAPASDPKADAAMHRALEWLKANQKASGGWESGNHGEMTSVTSLAVMAFLSAGHVPNEPGPYREAIERGVRYVLRNQKPNGFLVSNPSHGPMYCHGISTLMLAEVVGMAPSSSLADEIRPALVRAVELILKAQARKKPKDQEGGWRYQPDSIDSDLSVTGWQVMALRAAKSAGCAVSAEPIEKAIAYIKRCAHKDGGGFAYQAGGGPVNNPRTGTGTLALEICGEHLSPEAVAGAEYLLKHAPQWSSDYFFYEVYYAPQAMFQVGDKYFRGYYPKLVKVLLDHQDKNGSWLAGGGNDRTGGRVYCTSMAVLALAVEYRYLPIYQR